VDESESVDLFGVADQPPRPMRGEHPVVIRADPGEVVDRVVATVTTRPQVMDLEPAATSQPSTRQWGPFEDVALDVGGECPAWVPISTPFLDPVSSSAPGALRRAWPVRPRRHSLRRIDPAMRDDREPELSRGSRSP
jgi:hypothetical protein